MQITDPRTGSGLCIDSENRALTFSITEPEDKHINREGKVWSLYFTVTPAGANDYFFYFKNTGTEDVSISDIRISSSVVTEVTYEYVSGTPTYVTGTDVQITNRNLGSSKVPAVTAKYDTDITGLSADGILFFEECAAANTRYKLSTTSNIIITQGQAIAFKRVAATGLINCVVSVVGLES